MFDPKHWEPVDPEAFGVVEEAGGGLPGGFRLVGTFLSTARPGLVVVVDRPAMGEVALFCEHASDSRRAWRREGDLAVTARSGLPASAEGAVGRLVRELAGMPLNLDRQNAPDSRGTESQVAAYRAWWARALDSAPGSLQITDGCEEACAFCSAPASGLRGPATLAPADLVLERIDRWATTKMQALYFVSREPTLHPELASFIRRARSAAPWRIVLNTNGIRMRDPGLVTEYRDAGLDEVCISLHHHDAAVSDAITCRPRAFDATAAAIGNVVDAGIDLVVNFVVQTANHDAVVDFVKFLDHRHSLDRLKAVCLSVIGPVGDGTGRVDLMPRYSDCVGQLVEAVRMHDDVVLHPDYDVPLCVLPEDVRAEVVAKRRGRAKTGATHGRTYAVPCEQCSIRDECNGVWPAYLDAYGHDELHPVSR